MHKRLHGLDSLRFFAFFYVFLSHSTDFDITSFGRIGVACFFVISSFLLSYLAMNELEGTGSFSRSDFFARRALRILPLYYLILLFALILLPFIAERIGEYINLPDRPWMYWAFLSNYDTSDHMYALKFLWSIAVEEQFYLIFLALSPLFHKGMIRPAILLIVGYFTYMILAPVYAWSTFWSLPPYFIFFAAGMLAAQLFRSADYRPVHTGLFALALIIITALFELAEVWQSLSMAFIFASIVLTVVKFMQGKDYHRLIGIRWTEYWGRYTYGLYVYSGFVLTFVPLLLPIENEIAQWALNFGVLLLLSFLSYQLYEKQFLKLKNRFRWKRPA